MGEPIISGKHFRVTQPETLVGDILGAINEQGPCLFDRPLDLGIGHPVLQHLVDLFIKCFDYFIRMVFRVDGDGRVIQVRIDRCRKTAMYTDCKLVFHQLLIQPAGLIGNAAATEHVQSRWAGQKAVQHGKGEEIRVAGFRGMISDLYKRRLAGAVHFDPLLTGLRRFGFDDMGIQLLRLQGCKITVDLFQHLRRVENHLQ